jgi:hypothetical protein
VQQLAAAQAPSLSLPRKNTKQKQAHKTIAAFYVLIISQLFK